MSDVAGNPEDGEGAKGATRGAGRATMVDVAREAGVSLKTVSRVINGDAGVAPATADKVLAASQLLHYERNDLAASLRNGLRSNTVGLIIEDVTNPFYSTIAQAVEDCARERGSLLITASGGETPAGERELVTSLLRRRVDALLIVPAGSDHRYIAEAGFDTAMVFLDRPPAGLDADTVLIDDRESAERATEHLLEHGHRRIAFVGDNPELYTARERIAGYRGALERSAAGVDESLIEMGHSTPAHAREAVLRLLERPEGERPTALLTGNNRCTTGALQALGPERRLALVAFDDFELADLLEVSVVRTDPYRIGQLAAELAFGRLDGTHRDARHLIVPAELVARGSGELVRPAGRS